MLAKILAFLRKLAAPFRGVINGHEPQVVGFLVTAALGLLAHYNLHLSAYQQTVFVTVVAALVHWAVRGLVTPVTSRREAAQHVAAGIISANELRDTPSMGPDLP